MWLIKSHEFKSLWSSDVIWHHKLCYYWFRLWLRANQETSHYLIQWWQSFDNIWHLQIWANIGSNIITIFCAKPSPGPMATYCQLDSGEQTFNQNVIFIQDNAFENTVSEMSAALFRPQLNNGFILGGTHYVGEKKVRTWAIHFVFLLSVASLCYHEIQAENSWKSFQNNNSMNTIR